MGGLINGSSRVDCLTAAVDAEGFKFMNGGDRGGGERRTCSRLTLDRTPNLDWILLSQYPSGDQSHIIYRFQ
jgi:hypothetical protein